MGMCSVSLICKASAKQIFSVFSSFCCSVCVEFRSEDLRILVLKHYEANKSKSIHAVLQGPSDVICLSDSLSLKSFSKNTIVHSLLTFGWNMIFDRCEQQKSQFLEESYND